MKYFDKQAAKWHKKQRESFESDFSNRVSNREIRRKVDLFAIRNIEDKTWWRVLSKDEKLRVYNSYENTFAAASSKLGDKHDPTWYYYDTDIADVYGNSWEECMPQWLEYVKNKYPLDPIVRRDLSIIRVLS